MGFKTQKAKKKICFVFGHVHCKSEALLQKDITATSMEESLIVVSNLARKMEQNQSSQVDYGFCKEV
ncbi:MAG TPA: hypothetical protein VI278_08460 [Nitrososphaeraceae archaeon]